uniref:F-box domain-containing protein n=1 Tax=Trichobilharzia regenti TaxID=157069 RepID=A0AA85KHY5_TRIRE|nr:unnamed protein product [Trichobilharzia regenti]
MNQIPVEILFRIYRQLDIKDLENCSVVCKHWNTLINDLCLWTPKCCEKLSEYKWIDRELLILMKLCGIYKMKLFLQHTGTHHQQLNRRQLQHHHQMHPQSGYYMRKLFYRLHALSNENFSCQKDADCRPPSDGENITYYKCLMIGPAMDSSSINQCIIKHMIKASVWDQLPDDFIIPDPYLGRETKLIGRNIMIETPKFNTSMADEPLVNKNRLSGIYLLSNEHQGDGTTQPMPTLIPEIGSLIREYHVIIYTLDIRESGVDDINWDQISLEISAILNILGLDQSLLIVGVGDKYGKEACLSLTQLVDNLQSTILHESTLDVLENQLKAKNSCVQWRVWLTTSNGEDYDNLIQMIHWGLYRNQSIR